MAADVQGLAAGTLATLAGRHGAGELDQVLAALRSMRSVAASAKKTHKKTGSRAKASSGKAKGGRSWLPFEEARCVARSLQVKTRAEWEDLSKQGKRPQNIPSAPHRTYKGKGWAGYGDWLGTGNVHNKDWLPFEEAREFARNLGLRSKTAWEVWRKSTLRPKNIPTNPDTVYKKHGWNGYSDWLGTPQRLRKRKRYAVDKLSVDVRPEKLKPSFHPILDAAKWHHGLQVLGMQPPRPTSTIELMAANAAAGYAAATK